MTTIAVLGGGAGGLSAAVEHGASGHRIQLWNRRHSTIEALFDSPIEYDGVLGKGEYSPDIVTTNLAEATEGADVLLVCLPAIAHADLADDLAALGTACPIILNPGSTGGALEVAERFRISGVELPPLAEFSTLTYIARRKGTSGLSTTGASATPWAASLPGGAAALEAAQSLYPGIKPVDSVLTTSLSNINMVMHPPGAVLSAAWVEATGGQFSFYVDAMTPGVGTLMARLDRERLQVAEAYGLSLSTLVSNLISNGIVPPDTTEAAPDQGIKRGEANSRIAAPDGLSHRYYVEDFGFGLLPLTELASVVSIDIPVANSLVTVVDAVLGGRIRSLGRTAAKLGIVGKSSEDVRRSVGLE